MSTVPLNKHIANVRSPKDATPKLPLSAMSHNNWCVMHQILPYGIPYYLKALTFSPIIKQLLNFTYK